MLENNTKVIVCVPYGRHPSFRILEHYLRQNKHIIDQVHLWINTTDNYALSYAKNLCKNDDYFKYVEVPTPLRGMSHRNRSSRLIHFYQLCLDENTIYIKMDDDVVWMDEDAISNLVKLRIENPDLFLVSANLINNGICNHIHQRMGLLDSEPWATWDAGSGQGWWWNNFCGAIRCHENFLDKKSKNQENYFKFDKWLLFAERISINCICFFGKTLKEFTKQEWDILGSGDEDALTIHLPAKQAKYNAIAGKALMSHYSYFPQEGGLNQNTKILYEYAKLTEAKQVVDVCNYSLSIESNFIPEIKKGIELIRSASIEDLYNKDKLENLILQCGIYPNNQYIPPNYNNYFGGFSSYQNPKQLASMLLETIKHPITSYAECGVANGGTFIFITEFLKRTKNIKVSVACDILMPEFLFNYAMLEPIVKLYCGSAGSNFFIKVLRDNNVDFVFVDDDHVYNIAMQRYLAMKDFCKVMAFHDIDNNYCPELRIFWNHIKDKHQSFLFNEQYHKDHESMGAGLIIL